MADSFPWYEAELLNTLKFPSKKGAPALTVRMALGSLIIKEKLGLSDDETIEQIRENLYLQYFIGLESYQHEAPLDSSMLTSLTFGNVLSTATLQKYTKSFSNSPRKNRRKPVLMMIRNLVQQAQRTKAS